MARITLVLAGGPGYPEGSVHHRLELVLDLTPQGEPAGPAGTARHTTLEDVCVGEIQKLDEGWGLRRDAEAEAPWWRMPAQIMRPGELVVLHAPGGADLVYRVVAVTAD